MSGTDGIWSRTLEDLRLQMTKATFDTWLRGSRAVSLGGGTLTVAVRHAYALDWLNQRLMPVIVRTVRRLAGEDLTVIFVVDGRLPEEEEEEPAPGIEAGERLFEAVREEHVAGGAGHALVWTDFYIKLKVAFRKRALGELKGSRLSVFLCLALHVDRDGVASPGIDTIMRETRYSRSIVCNALEELVRSGMISKRPSYRGADEYVVNGYAWFGQQPAPSLWEERTEP